MPESILITAAIHSAQTFHDYFRDIPDDRWLVGDTSDGKGGFDALGHLPDDQSRAALEMILVSRGHPDDINDGGAGFPLDEAATPRLRILAALEAVGAAAPPQLQAA